MTQEIVNHFKSPRTAAAFDINSVITAQIFVKALLVIHYNPTGRRGIRPGSACRIPIGILDMGMIGCPIVST